MRLSKILQRGGKNKSTVERSEELPPGKISKPPIHQEHTKTQNSTKVADTTNK